MNETQAADAASHKKGKQLPQSGFMAHHVMLAFFFPDREQPSGLLCTFLKKDTPAHTHTHTKHRHTRAGATRLPTLENTQLAVRVGRSDAHDTALGARLLFPWWFFFSACSCRSPFSPRNARTPHKHHRDKKSFFFLSSSSTSAT